MVGTAALLAAVLAAPVLSIQPGVARAGDLVLVHVDEVSEPPRGTLGSATLSFHAMGTGFGALTALPIEQKPGTLAVRVVLGEGKSAPKLEGGLEIEDYDFPRKTLTVSRRFTNLSKKDRRWSAQDKVAYAAAWAQEDEPWLFGDDFAWPRPPDITAPYGDRRFFNGKLKSRHYGVDMDGETGDAILAANAGVVVMVRGCFGSGNTVLLHHGGRLFTAYFHLSAFEVKAGDVVERGQLLGKVGKTGRVTGPHLHYGVKFDGRWVDPYSLTRLRFPFGDAQTP